MVRGRSSKRGVGRGFTLVELLVVIVIISILVGLILPAMQGVRETARRLTCSNNLYQMGRGCLAHESAQGFYPTGGWFYRWAGDPNQGFTIRQPGGWNYNILPYIDLNALHDMGKGMGLNPPQDARDGSGANGRRMQLGAQMAATPVAVFCCPSRRKPIAFPYMDFDNWHFYNVAMNTSSPIARTDYASNGGDCQYDCSGWGPDPDDNGDADSYAEGMGTNLEGADTTNSNSHHWNYPSGFPLNPSNPNGVETGVIFRHATICVAQIRKGTSYTYLIGEKFLDSAFYTANQFQGDETGWIGGFSSDSTRWTGYNGYSVKTAPDQSSNGSNYTNAVVTVPHQDYMVAGDWNNSTGGGGNDWICFGSAHPNTFGMAMCDGSVHQVSYSIDPEVHRILGNRLDKTPFDLTVIK